MANVFTLEEFERQFGDVSQPSTTRDQEARNRLANAFLTTIASPVRFSGEISGINALTRAGEGIESGIDRIAPTDPLHEGLSLDLMSGIGSMGGFMTPGALVGAGPKLGALLASGLGASSQGLSGLDDARQMQATPEQEQRSLLANTMLGTLEGVPIGRVFGRASPSASDIATSLTGDLWKIIKEGGKGAAEEAAQEGFTQFGSNVIASDIAGYDPEREATKDVAYNAMLGAILGGPLSAGASASAMRRNPTADAQDGSAIPVEGEIIPPGRGGLLGFEPANPAIIDGAAQEVEAESAQDQAGSPKRASAVSPDPSSLDFSRPLDGEQEIEIIDGDTTEAGFWHKPTNKVRKIGDVAHADVINAQPVNESRPSEAAVAINGEARNGNAQSIDVVADQTIADGAAFSAAGSANPFLLPAPQRTGEGADIKQPAPVGGGAATGPASVAVGAQAGAGAPVGDLSGSGAPAAIQSLADVLSGQQPGAQASARPKPQLGFRTLADLLAAAELGSQSGGTVEAQVVDGVSPAPTETGEAGAAQVERANDVATSSETGQADAGARSSWDAILPWERAAWLRHAAGANHALADKMGDAGLAWDSLPVETREKLAATHGENWLAGNDRPVREASALSRDATPDDAQDNEFAAWWGSEWDAGIDAISRVTGNRATAEIEKAISGGISDKNLINLFLGRVGTVGTSGKAYTVEVNYPAAPKAVRLKLQGFKEGPKQVTVRGQHLADLIRATFSTGVSDTLEGSRKADAEPAGGAVLDDGQPSPGVSGQKQDGGPDAEAATESADQGDGGVNVASPVAGAETAGADGQRDTGGASDAGSARGDDVPRGNPHTRAAARIADLLDANENLAEQKAALKSILDAAYGGTTAAGAYTSKDGYEAIELGINTWIARNANRFNPSAADPFKVHDDLVQIVNAVPRQRGRDVDTDAFQQFSTPPQYAHAAAWLANVKPGDVVLEPSAGNGGLAVFAKNAGARVIANEIDPTRIESLRSLGLDRVFTENAEQIDNILPRDVMADVVLMNPPFGSSGVRNVKEGAELTRKHIDQALQRLKPGGRLVAITGHTFTAGNKKVASWFADIAKKYNIRAGVHVDGKEYGKYGTSYGTRVWVIDNNGPTIARPKVSTDPASLSAILKALDDVRNDRGSTEQSPAEPVVAETAAAVEGAAGANTPVRDAVAGSGGPGNTVRAQRDPDAAGDRAEGVDDDAAKADAVADNGRRREGDRDRGAVDAGQGDAAGRRGGAGGTRRSQDAGADAVEAVRLADEAVEAASEELTESAFSDYRPQRVRIAGARAHPAKLVQSAAMASVLPVKADYAPKLPAKTIKDGLLSDAQLENIVYAGQAHSQVLPAPVGEKAFRRGYFIGDGTGVGKGRQIAGIIADNMAQGRSKHVWISEKWPLFNDAKRDMAGIGGDASKIVSHEKLKGRKLSETSEGVLFTTYSTLASKWTESDSNLAGLVKWLGPDFDGVIAFDEAHNMANAVPIKGKRGVKKPSQAALSGLELQKLLPNARVVYVSATGATEISNLSYASRLGLWGFGTPFASVNEFITKVSQGGVAAMELIARDMKAMGSYLARSISYDGVSYARLEHALTAPQRKIYDTAAKAWQVVLQNINEALKETGAVTQEASNSAARAAALAQFWGSHQRFFNQVMTAMQLPTVLKQIRKDIDAGNAVVIQIVNTNEAATERALGKMEDEYDIDALDLTPREMLMSYLENSFPVAQHESYTDDDGNVRTRPVRDSNGNPVESAAAVRRREKLLNQLATIAVPENPIDAIISEFGSDNVAEITGRKRRVITVDGQRQVQKLGSTTMQGEADAFMGGSKDILIFSDAGGTGRSYHADMTAKNQKRRMHYLLQPGWRADKAVQGFGRTHRTNQKSAPHYYMVSTDIEGHKRFVSSIARRLDQLGALTKGQRDTGGQGMFSSLDNLESDYAQDALRAMFKDMARGKASELSLSEVSSELGLNLIDPNTGAFLEGKIPEIPQFLNRLLSLTLDRQKAVFGEFIRRLEDNIEAAKQRGDGDFGMETIRADKVRKTDDKVIFTDKRTDVETRMVQIELQRKNHPTKWAEISSGEYRGQAVLKFVRNERSEAVYAVVKANSRTDRETGEIFDQYRLVSPTASRLADEKVIEAYNSAYKPVKGDEAEALWNAAVEAAPEYNKSVVDMVVGAILPVWDRLPSEQGKMQVYRVRTDDGETLLGRVIAPKNVADVLKAFGASRTFDQSPGEVRQALDSGQIAELSNGWMLRRRKVNGDWRYEVMPKNPYEDERALKMTGAVQERIEYKMRYFIPAGDKFEQVLGNVLTGRQIVNMILPKGLGEGVVPALEEPGVDPSADKGIARNELGNDYFEPDAGFASGVDGVGENAKRYVIERGARDGVEYLVAVDGDSGQVVSAGKGAKSHVGFSDVMQAALADPSRNIVVHHNHPTGTSLSPQDIRQFFQPGLAKIYAHTPDGQTYSATISLELRNAMAVARPRDGYGFLFRITDSFYRATERALNQLIAKGTVSTDDANKHWAHIGNRSLHAAGLLEYDAPQIALDDLPEIQRIYQLSSESDVPRSMIKDFIDGNKPSRSDRRTFPVRLHGSLGGAPETGRGAAGQRDFKEGTGARGKGADRTQEGAAQRLSDRFIGVREGPDQAPVFFSAVGRAVERAPQAKATAEQWKAMIAKTPGVRRDEIEWLGIEEWLDSQSGAIAREDVFGYVAANALTVSEVLKAAYSKDFDQDVRDWHGVDAQAWDALSGGEQHEMRTEFIEETDAAVPGDTPKYGLYVTPGGKDYHELLLTLPNADYKSAHWDEKGVIAHVRFQSQEQEIPFTAEERAQIERRAKFQSEFDSLTAELGKAIRQTRSERDPAIKAKRDELMEMVRRGEINAGEFNRRYEAAMFADVETDGMRLQREIAAKREALSQKMGPEPKQRKESILHIEEIQSDWHQAGRKKGYKESRQTRADVDAKKKAAEEMLRRNDLLGFDALIEARRAIVNDPIDNWEFNSPEDRQIAIDYRDAVNALPSRDGVPDAPFKTTWSELAFKRMLRWAVDNGFDRIVWTPGEQQAERYDLSKQIQSITYQKRAGDVYALWFTGKNDREEQSMGEHTAEQLPDQVGKDVAERIVKGQGEETGFYGSDAGKRTLSGLDLQIGGEGMVAFYDKMLPATVNKLVKRWGGKVEKGKVKSGGVRAGATDVWSLEITDAMRDEIPLGVGLFEETGNRFSDPPSNWHVPDRGVFSVLADSNIALIRRMRAGMSTQLWKATFDAFRVKFQDRFLPMLRVEQAIERYTGSSLPPEMKVYLAEELYTGRAGSRLDRIERQFMEPITHIMRENNIPIEDVDEFLYARHATERNARIAEINERFAEGGGSGMTDEEASGILDTVRNSPQAEAMERIGALVDGMLRASVRYRVRAGLLSQEDADAWSKYEHYVPLRGFDEVEESGDKRPNVGKGYSVRGKESRMALGRESKAGNVLATAFTVAQEAVIRGEKNRVVQRLLDLAATYPNKEYWEVNPVRHIQVFNRATGMVYRRAASPLSADEARNTISVKVNGIEHRMSIHDGALRDAIMGLNPEQMGSAIHMMMKTGRFLSAINTSWNAEFILRNAVRDIQSAVVRMGTMDQSGLIKGVLADYRKSMAAAYRGLRGKAGRNEYDRWWKEYSDAGGRVSFFYTETINDVHDRIDKMSRQIGAKDYRTVWRGFTALRDFIEDVNLAVDNTLRVSLYKNLRERGVSKDDAASAAKNLTVNFNRRGQYGPFINAFYLFFNAGVQGSAMVINTLRHKRGQQFATGMIAGGFMLGMLNALMGFEDENGENEYDKLVSEREHALQSNTLIMLPWEGKDGGQAYATIPSPYGFNLFPTIGRKISEYARGVETMAGALSDIAVTAANSFNPLGGSDSVLKMLSPTLTDPLVEIVENKDFAGRKIRPDMQKYNPSVPYSQDYYESSAPLSRHLAKVFNDWTGGNDFKPGVIDVSPEWIDHYAAFAGGGMASSLWRPVNTTMKMVRGEGVNPTDIPFARSFYGGTGDYLDRSMYFRRVDEIKAASHQVKGFSKRGDIESVNALDERTRRLAAMDGKPLRELDKQLDAIRDARNDAMSQPLSAAERSERLKKLNDAESRLIRNFHRAYRAATGRNGE